MFALFSALAYADGQVTNEEFNFLFHSLSRRVSHAAARELVDRFSVSSAAAAEALLWETLPGVASRPLEERILYLLFGYDFAAVDGIESSELGLLDRIGDTIGVGEQVRAILLGALRWGEPGSRISTAEVPIRVAHVGPSAGDDIPLDVGAHFSLVDLSGRLFFRVAQADTPLTHGDELVPMRCFIELGPESRIEVARTILRAGDLRALLESASEPWAPCELADPLRTSFLGASFRALTRGTLLAVEATGGDLEVNGRTLSMGERRVLLPRDEVKSGGAPSLRLKDLISCLQDTRGMPRAEATIFTGGIAGMSADEAAGDPKQSSREGMASLSVRGVSYAVGPTVLVDDVSLEVQEGELVAFIGPSGCGKTTLLELIAGKKRPCSGEVLLRDSVRTQPVARAKARIGFVPQDEVLLPQLTVLENVRSACRLRCPNLTRGEATRAADEALGEVGLASRRTMRVGHPDRRLLSGGQRRRVSVAMEMVARPDVFLLDEPLSGLSSFDARNIMRLLGDLAARGHAVLVVVHQPSAELFELFDKVLVLDQGGKAAFFGPPGEAVRYFAEHGGQLASPSEARGATEGGWHPDIILDTMEQQVFSSNAAGEMARSRVYPPDYWAALYKMRRSEAGETLREEEPPAAVVAPDHQPLMGPFRYRAWVTQFLTILSRHVLVRLRNRGAMVLSLLVAPFLGVLLSVVLRNSEGLSTGEELAYSMSLNELMLIYLFMVPVVVMFFGLSGSCTEFINERRLLRHEGSLGIPSIYYLVSKLGVLMAWTALEVYLFLLVSTEILEIPGPFNWFWGLAYLTAFVAVSLGLLVSAVAPNARVAYAVVPMILIPQLVFSGVVPYEQMNPAIYIDSKDERDDAPLIGDLMASRWCYEGLVVAMAQENPFREKLRAVDERQRRIGPEDWEARDALWEERREVLAMKSLCENTFVRRLFERGNDRYLSCQQGAEGEMSTLERDSEKADEMGVPRLSKNVLFAGERSVFGRIWPTPVFAGGVLVAQSLAFLMLCLFALRRMRQQQ